MNKLAKTPTANGRPEAAPEASTIPIDPSYLPRDPLVDQATQASGFFSSLVLNVLLPLTILLGGAGIIVALGSVVPKSRDADDQTLAGRMQRLPAADVAQVLALSQIDKPLELRVDGVVVPFREVALAAEVSGRIVKKSPACEAGNFVKQGDLLLEIDAVDYEQDVERLSRMREQDYEAIKEVDQEVVNTQRLVTVALEDVALQEREVKRLDSMPEGFASQGEVDKSKKSLLIAVQSKISFENQLNLLTARRGKLEASERLATTELRGAEINLERTKVYSPVDGVIVRENAELNSFIQRGSPIVTLDDISKAEVAVNLRMDQLHWVLDQNHDAAVDPATPANASPQLTADEAATSPGYSLPRTAAVIEYKISGRNDKTYRWDGMLVRYDGIGLDTRSRTVPVRIVVDRPRQFVGEDKESLTSASPSPLVRGMFVSVRLLIRPKTSLVAIPSLAIQPGNRVWQFVQDDSVLEPKKTPAADAAVSETKGSTTESSKTANDFDPALWHAGRVIVRRGIVPVDSLWLSTSDDVTDSANAKAADANAADANAADSNPKERRYWICEVTGGEMAGGDWVVSSPLSDFDSQLPVRVPSSELK